MSALADHFNKTLRPFEVVQLDRHQRKVPDVGYCNLGRLQSFLHKLDQDAVAAYMTRCLSGLIDLYED
jgi:hypothetical protein